MLAIMGAIGILTAIPAESEDQVFVGTAGEELEYIVIILILVPVPAGGPPTGDLVAAKAFQSFSIVLAEKIVG